MNILKTQSKKLIIFEIVCILVMICMIGITYSFFTATATNTGEITGSAASMNISLTVTKESPNNTKGLVPQLDEYITSAVVGRNGSCIDDNNNSVCQVYKIEVKNNSAAAISVSGKLELNEGNNPNLKWAEISGLTNPTVLSSKNSYSYKKLKTNVSFNANETKTYYIVVWISETGIAQSDNGSFSGVVTFGDADSLSESKATLTKLRLTSNGTKDSFASAATTNEGVFEAQDDLGTSYYFRGAAENNYVKFAGYYWRIIRINGDGTIRMIYDGTSAHANGESSTDRRMTTKAYNSSYNDNAYVGYMYGSSGASTYAEAHANTNDSTIKDYLDSWYETNIEGTTYEQYVVDAIYCNDRKIDTNAGSLNGYTGYTTLGYGTNKTVYAATARVGYNITNPSPTLLCEQDNDKFTVSSTLGNGDLTYPIGLITADEVAMAGGLIYKDDGSASNSNYYLYMGSYYWTMSPFGFDGSLACSFGVSGSGYLNNDGVYGNFGARGVISLSSSAILYGTGTSTDPFRLTPE